MCGIFGVLAAESAEIPRDLAKSALELLSPRGPDDHGWYDGPQVVLGHRRLTIMDLSIAGRQPMSNEDGSVWITFNGEIYDFRDLRDELVRDGHRFRSTSDTEVIVHGYEKWGRGILDRIDGMFALAIWDARRKRLLLARDRLGKKPLFVARRNGLLGFSSQLRPLETVGLVRPAVDPDALREYLFLGYVIGPKTIFADAELVPAGTWLEATPDTLEVGRYWDLLAAKPQSEVPAQETFERLLVAATRARLVSDAPLGVFLSGGVDSSLVAAIAQKESPVARSSFAVGFDDPSYDERDKARRVALRLGTDHHETVCVAADVPNIMPALARSADHLLADQSMVPLAKLSIEAKRSVKVVLTGDGGDEVLAGYPTYQALALARHYVRFVPKPLRVGLQRLATYLPAGVEKMSSSTLVKRFLDATTGDLAEAHSSWRCVWTRREIDALLAGRWRGKEEWRDYADRVTAVRDGTLLQSAVFADIAAWLVDSILAKVDRTTMSAGLEARAPLLDHRLVEFAFGTLLAGRRWNLGKKPIRTMAASLLGNDVATTKKAGFQTPFAGWFAGPLRRYVEDRLEFLDSSLPGVFEVGFIRQIEADHASRRHNHDLKLWNLVALSEWTALYSGLWVDDRSNAVGTRIYDGWRFSP